MDKFSLLPSLNDKTVLLRWEEDFRVVCDKCPGRRVALEDLEAHKRWHERVNLLYCLKDRVAQEQFVFGPKDDDDDKVQTEGVLALVDNDKADYTQDLSPKGIEMFLRTDCHPLATMKCVEGQKYTFGQFYTSREEDGEFVFFKPKEEEGEEEEEEGEKWDAGIMGPAVLETYFQLEVKEGGLWMRSIMLNAKSAPVEDVQIARNGNLMTDPTALEKLSFGDVISLTFDTGRKFRFYDFVLLPLVLLRRRKEYQATPDHSGGNPLENSLIVAHTFRSLPISVSLIKKLRLVSRTWGSEGLNILQKECAVKVFDRRKKQDFDYHMQIFKFVQEMQQHKFEHWKIRLPNIPLSAVNCPSLHQQSSTMDFQYTKGRKLADDFKWLLSNEFVHNVRTLTLEASIKSFEDINLVVAILRCLSPTLTSLELRLHFESFADVRSQAILFPSDPSCPLELPILKTAVVLCNIHNNITVPYCMESFIHLFKGLKEVQRLDLRYENNIYTVIDFRNLCYMELLTLTSESFKNLTHVVIERSSDVVLDHISKFMTPAQLRKIELYRIESDDTASSYYLLSALGNYAAVLEELTLHIRVRGEVQLQFPTVMKKLKSLSIFAEFKEDCTKVDRFDIQFGTGVSRRSRIEYSVNFPSLESLTIWPVQQPNQKEGKQCSITVEKDKVSWERFLPLLKCVIPDHDSPSAPFSTSLKSLDIPIRLNHEYHGVLDQLETRFPNVNFPSEMRIAGAIQSSPTQVSPRRSYSDTDNSISDEGSYDNDEQ